MVLVQDVFLSGVFNDVESFFKIPRLLEAPLAQVIVGLQFGLVAGSAGNNLLAAAVAAYHILPCYVVLSKLVSQREPAGP